jgi:hypothetical protein
MKSLRNAAARFRSLTVRRSAAGPRAGAALFLEKDTIMRISLKPLVLASAIFCASAAMAADLVTVNVPFTFTAMGQSFPAGHYDIAVTGNNSLVTLYSKTDATKRLTWVVRPADARKAPGVVTFDALGTNHSLKNIQVGSRITPNLDPQVNPGVSATTSISNQ